MLVQELFDNITFDTDNIESVDFIYQKPYINAAIDILSFTLAGLNDAEMMVVADIAPGTAVPNNFVSFIPANGYPVYAVGGVFKTLTGNTVFNVRYSIVKPHITALTDTLPFKDMYGSVLMMITSLLINKRTPDISIAQDQKILTMVLDAISKAKAKGG